jgi:hypothetical protein
MSKTRRVNLGFGIMSTLAFLAVGFILGIRLDGGPEELDQMSGHWMALGYLSGIGMGILNVVFGLVVRRLSLRGRLLSLGAALSIGGGIIGPAALFLVCHYRNALTVAAACGLAVLVAWGIIAWSILFGKAKLRPDSKSDRHGQFMHGDGI